MPSVAGGPCNAQTRRQELDEQQKDAGAAAEQLKDTQQLVQELRSALEAKDGELGSLQQEIDDIAQKNKRLEQQVRARVCECACA